jgi:hypothetical protein
MDGNELVERRRVRRRSQEVERLVSEFESSGMKRVEFCRLHGLAFNTLQRHLSRRKQKAKQVGRLVRVEVEDKARQRAGAIEIVLGRGRRIAVGPGFDAGTLEEIIAVLERG